MTDECRLAYGLHEKFGRVCSRKGGNAVCGVCISDPNAPILGFRRKSDLSAVHPDLSDGGMRIPEITNTPLSGHETPPHGHSEGDHAP